MSSYTTELRFICESLAGYRESTDRLKVSDVIDKARPKVFDFDYPIFDEAYRAVLEKKILYHYYTREIAHETRGLWQLKLQVKLNEIMPYFNKLYQSELLTFNPLYDVDLHRTHTTTNSGTQETDATLNSTNTENGTTGNDTTIHNNGTNITDNTIEDEATSTNKNVFSETPQGTLTGVDNNSYLSDYRKIDNTDNKTSTGHTVYDTEDTSTTNISGTNSNTANSDTSTNSKTDISNTEEYLESVTGKQGMTSYSDLLIRFRETFLNIDMQVIEELNELFFTLW